MLAILSDIHGNYPALEAVLGEIDTLGITDVISLGDVAGYYCMINECIDALSERSIPNLMGNHDFYIVSGRGCRRSSRANLCLEYQRKVINEAGRAWLAQSLSDGVRRGPLSMVHGGWIDPMDEYMDRISEDYFAGREGEVFVSGHTHVQGVWRLRTKIYCNPGSVGQPRDGDPRAAYAVWDGHKISLRRVDYDIDAICGRMVHAGFDASFFENLRKGARIGGGYSRVRGPDE